MWLWPPARPLRRFFKTVCPREADRCGGRADTRERQSNKTPARSNSRFEVAARMDQGPAREPVRSAQATSRFMAAERAGNFWSLKLGASPTRTTNHRRLPGSARTAKAARPAQSRHRSVEPWPVPKGAARRSISESGGVPRQGSPVGPLQRYDHFNLPRRQRGAGPG